VRLSMKYALLEREQRFLLAEVPKDVEHISAKEIYDRYLVGTGLRLRVVKEPDGMPVLKLGQKVRLDGPPPQAVAHTTMYLNEEDYGVLAALPAAELTKSRRVAVVKGTTVAVDEFHGRLEGLVLAEIDLGEVGEVQSSPPQTLADVTEDERFTGGALATTSADSLQRMLSDFRL